MRSFSLDYKEIFLAIFLVLVGFAVHPACGEERILLSITTDPASGLEKDTLYSMKPDGSELKPIFDFGWNAFDSTGMIFDLSVSSNGKKIFFSSNNGKLWTPLNRNIFMLNSDGTGIDQITPLLSSGSWSQMCQGCGRVTGYVRKSNGDPWIGALVFLEGMQLQNADTDGYFVFNHVPPGVHNLIVYRPGQTDAYTFMPVDVKAGLTSDLGVLNPNRSGKSSLDRPKPYGNYVFYRQYPGDIIRLDLNTGMTSKVYDYAPGSCIAPEVYDFAIDENRGRMFVSDYADGCPGHMGIYVMNSDGSDLNLFASFKHDAWCGVGDIALSQDGGKIAAVVCYNYYYGLVILDVATAQILGQAWVSPELSPTFTSFHVNGWSPDGNFLLYSMWKESPAQTTLFKVDVSSMENNNPVSAPLYNGAVNSAVWANLERPDTKPASTVTVSVGDANRVRIAWSSVPGASGYFLYYAPYPGADPIEHVDMGTQTSFQFQAPRGTAYYLAVIPYDMNKKTGDFAFSNIVQFIVE